MHLQANKRPTNVPYCKLKELIFIFMQSDERKLCLLIRQHCSALKKRRKKQQFINKNMQGSIGDRKRDRLETTRDHDSTFIKQKRSSFLNETLSNLTTPCRTNAFFNRSTQEVNLDKSRTSYGITNQLIHI